MNTVELFVLIAALVCLVVFIDSEIRHWRRARRIHEHTMRTLQQLDEACRNKLAKGD